MSKKSYPSVLVKVIILVFFITISFLNPAIADNEDSYKSIKLFTEILEELENNYVDKVNTEKLVHNAIKGMVENLDPHSTFMPPEAFEKLQDDTRGNFSGIGIVITLQKGLLTVISPIEGTPAYEAGIQAGDVIIKIDEKSTRGMALWEAVNLMRGPKGKKIEITLVRVGTSSPIILTLKRDTIPLDSVKSTKLKPGIGYIRITNFRKDTVDHVEKALKDFGEQDATFKGLVIDLRHNPGGLLDQAIKVSDLFLEQGKILITKGRLEQDQEVFSATPNKNPRNYPIIVLINGGSASASEIVAGALQDNGRALILGTTSFGKASVQTVIPLKDGYGIKYTIARYYTPNGRSIQAKGIEPDIVVLAGEVVKQAKKEEIEFDRLVKEKDLVNHLEPEEKKKEKTKKDKQKKNGHGLLDLETLQKDIQINRALDILISYGVFNNLNGKKEEAN
ncbi:MAG: S41 family peptidase [Desulfobacterales bacterium]|nr:S41 family peptidase [Desulfobacterales bacterium]